jgi:hypothetical protein
VSGCSNMSQAIPIVRSRQTRTVKATRWFGSVNIVMDREADEPCVLL